MESTRSPRQRPTGVVPSLSSAVTPTSEPTEDSPTQRLPSSEDAPTLHMRDRVATPARAVLVTNPDTPTSPPLPDDFADGDEHRTDPWSLAQRAAATEDDADHDIVDGRYRLERILGQGGMARTFLASHLRLGKPFALKALHGNLVEEPQMRDFFHQEALLASQLHHPHIVQVTDFGQTDSLGPYLVMELLVGQTLRQRLQQHGPLRPDRALDFVLQVADAVHYLHEKGIIHRDIKPDNIFVCAPQGRVQRRPVLKLVDFGLARREVLGAKLSHTELIGTPVYMAPEQLMRAAPQPAMDIYALGALLYELLTGQPPFRGAVDDIVKDKPLRPPEPPSASGLPGMGEALDHLVLKALAPEPSHRHPSVAQLIFELRTVMAMIELGSTRWELPDPAASLVATNALEQGFLAFESSPFPQFTVTASGRLLSGNAAFGAFLGCEVAPLRGATVPGSAEPDLSPARGGSAARPVLGRAGVAGAAPRAQGRPFGHARGVVGAPAVGGGRGLRLRRPHPPARLTGPSLLAPRLARSRRARPRAGRPPPS